MSLSGEIDSKESELRIEVLTAKFNSFRVIIPHCPHGSILALGNLRRSRASVIVVEQLFSACCEHVRNDCDNSVKHERQMRRCREVQRSS